MKRRIFCLLLALALASALVSGCGKQAEPVSSDAGAATAIGISLPNDSDAQWTADAAILRQQLAGAGYDVDIRYAGDSPDTQIEQIRALLDGGCTVLIVAAVDASALSTAFRLEDDTQDTRISGGSASDGSSSESAEDTFYNSTPIDDGITVISYDRLISDCSAVDYYVGFDGYEAGYLQACCIEEALSLYDTDGTYSIELFFDGADTAAAGFQYEGAMEVLQVYIDSGVLQVRSGQTALEDCAAAGYEGAAARMQELLDTYYQDAPLDAVLCANDQIAQGVNGVLFSGYTGGVYPIVTGMGCEDVSVNAVLTGLQAMTLLKDYTGMAQEAAAVAAAFAGGSAPETLDSVDNGRVNVPASLFYPEEIYSSDVRDVLISRGYFADNGDGTVSSATDYTMGYTGTGETTPEEELSAENTPPEEVPAGIEEGAEP